MLYANIALAVSAGIVGGLGLVLLLLFLVVFPLLHKFFGFNLPGLRYGYAKKEQKATVSPAKTVKKAVAPTAKKSASKDNIANDMPKEKSKPQMVYGVKVVDKQSSYEETGLQSLDSVKTVALPKISSEPQKDVPVKEVKLAIARAEGKKTTQMPPAKTVAAKPEKSKSAVKAKASAHPVAGKSAPKKTEKPSTQKPKPEVKTTKALPQKNVKGKK